MNIASLISKINIKDKVNLRQLMIIILSSLVVLILFSPTVFKYLKLGHLLILMVISLLTIYKYKKVPIYSDVLKWILIFVSVNLFFLIRGAGNDIETFIQLAPLNIIWPLVYTISMIIPAGWIKKFELSKAIIIATMLIEIYILYYYFNFIGVLPEIHFMNIQLGQTINYNFDYVNLFVPNITSLFFLIPYLISLLLMKKQKSGCFILYSILTLVGLVVSVIIGRRTLILLILASPFIALFWIFISNKKQTKSELVKSVVILSTLIVIGVIFIAFSDIGLRINNLNIEIIANGTDIRILQFNALIDGWKDSPLLGTGFGVNADVIRSDVKGMYELSYVAKLFHTGIIGVTIYLLLIVWIFRRLIQIIKRDSDSSRIIVPLLTGLSCVLIAESTNPYMSSFDGIWMIFYALSIINSFELNNRVEGI